MKLYIDTSNSEEIKVGLDADIQTADSREEKAQMLLPFIIKILKDQKKNLKSITEIQVNTGTGSFTGLRIGVSVANALGWSLKIPVNGKKVWEGKTVDIVY